MNNITLEDIALRTYREEKSKETFNNIPVIVPAIVDRAILIEKDKEIERLNNIIKIKTDFIEELLKIIAVARDYELHDKCYTRAKIYEEKLKELKGSDSNE